MDYLLSFIFSATEIIALAFIANTAFTRRNKKDVLFYSVLILSVLLAIPTAIVLRTYSLLIKSVVSVFILFCSIAINYKGSMGYKIFLCVAYYAAILAMDYLIMSMYILCFSFSYSAIVQSKVIYVVSVSTSKLIVLSFSYIFKKICAHKCKKSEMSFSHAWSLLVIPCFSVFNIAIIFDNALKQDEINAGTMSIAIGLLICNIAAVFLWDRLENENQLRLDNALLQQQNKSTMDKTLALESVYVKQRKLTHDFKNHARVLQGLLEAEAYDEAKKHLFEWTCESSETKEIIHTNNHLLDVIFNQKYEYAKQNGVVVSFLINDLSEIQMGNSELVTLLTNILDNAIEAAILCEGDKLVQVKMMHRPGTNLLISVSNTSNYVKITNNQIKTTKDNPIEHGFGLSNIEQIVRKYDGQFLLSYQNNLFQITTIIPQTM